MQIHVVALNELELVVGVLARNHVPGRARARREMIPEQYSPVCVGARDEFFGDAAVTERANGGLSEPRLNLNFAAAFGQWYRRLLFHSSIRAATNTRASARPPLHFPVPHVNSLEFDCSTGSGLLRNKIEFDRICAVAASETATEMATQLRRGLRMTRTAELRLDWLRSDSERRRFLAWLKPWLRRQRPFPQLIATCRRSTAGGRYPGSVAAERAILEAAAQAGCRWYDLEIESVEAKGQFEPMANGLGWPIVSIHRFGRRAGNPSALLRRFRPAGEAVWKLATECRSLRDSVRLIRTVQKAADGHPMILIPMGGAAQPMRILALRDASLLTYAAVSGRTAPGQPTLETVCREYRANRIDRRTRVYGVIGNPLGHSISPSMHNAAFAALGVNAVYLPFPVEDLEDFLAVVGPLGLRGFSITIPYKQAIFARLHACDPLAKRLGAVNTVIVRAGRLYGYNTDYAGVLAALRGRVQLKGCQALLVGAGGAARAAGFALADSGASVSIFARRESRARELARAIGGTPIARPRIRRQDFDLIVNATPVGMTPDKNSPLSAPEINAPVVFDMVYRPLNTPLLRLAARKGLRAISGLDMLVAQGAQQCDLWTGGPAPIRLMRQAALAALGQVKDNR
jgi:3-dehydroquinate dehydratase/shikimate dehydrogenase